MRSLYWRWIGLRPGRWIRCSACLSRSQARQCPRCGIGPGCRRPRVGYSGDRRAASIAGGDGNLASKTSTPRSTSIWATSIFSVRFILQPGDCSAAGGCQKRRLAGRRLDMSVCFLAVNSETKKPQDATQPVPTPALPGVRNQVLVGRPLAVVYTRRHVLSSHRYKRNPKAIVGLGVLLDFFTSSIRREPCLGPGRR